MTRGRHARGWAAAAAAVALVAGARGASADGLLQKPRPRQGYYIALGGQGTMIYASENGDGVGPMPGFAVTLRLGQMITPRLGLGIAMDGGSASSGDDSATLAGLALAGQIEVARNVALHAAVGLGVVTLSGPDDRDGESRGVAGAGYTVGLTWDWFTGHRQSGGLALTPGVRLRVVPGDTDAFAALVGVELTWWTGLPENQLDLDAASAFRR